MKTLLLMRHAKASQGEGDDHDRALSSRGERTLPVMAALLRDEGIVPDLIVSSTALRARATALSVAEALGWKPEVRLRRALYMAQPSDILREAARVPEEVSRVLLVGHNPGIEDLVSELSGSEEHLPTGAIARLSLHVSYWADLAGTPRAELVRVWRPKEVD